MSGTGGWATKLAGSKLDRREGQEVIDLEDVKAANTWISEVLGL
jgi:hypothetical protein